MFRTREELVALVAFEREWRELIDRVEIGGAMPVKLQIHNVFGMHMLNMYMSVPDVHHGHDSYVQQRVPLPEYMKAERDRLLWLQHQVLRLYQHELQEQFKFNGVQIFDPHKA